MSDPSGLEGILVIGAVWFGGWLVFAGIVTWISRRNKISG